MLKHIKRATILLSIILLAATGKNNPEPHPDKDVDSTLGTIQELCHDNYRISYYTDSAESVAVGENPEMVWALFFRGDLECDFRGACLTEVEVNRQGIPRFLCQRR